MIVRRIDELAETERDVKSKSGTWRSVRFLLKQDQMGFSFHETTIYKGTETLIWYKNHLEAVYCVGGSGEIELTESGEKFPITDGTMYALDKNERHILRAHSDMRMICTFNPPLTGREDHDNEGVYPVDE